MNRFGIVKGVTSSPLTVNGLIEGIRDTFKKSYQALKRIIPGRSPKTEVSGDYTMRGGQDSSAFIEMINMVRDAPPVQEGPRPSLIPPSPLGLLMTSPRFDRELDGAPTPTYKPPSSLKEEDEEPPPPPRIVRRTDFPTYKPPSSLKEEDEEPPPPPRIVRRTDFPTHTRHTIRRVDQPQLQDIELTSLHQNPINNNESWAGVTGVVGYMGVTGFTGLQGVTGVAPSYPVAEGYVYPDSSVVYPEPSVLNKLANEAITPKISRYDLMLNKKKFICDSCGNTVEQTQLFENYFNLCEVCFKKTGEFFEPL